MANHEKRRRTVQRAAGTAAFRARITARERRATAGEKAEAALRESETPPNVEQAERVVPRPPESPKKKLRKRMPEDLAREAISYEEPMPGGKVRMTVRIVLTREQAEALAAQAIREGKNIRTLVKDILGAAAAVTRRQHAGR